MKVIRKLFFSTSLLLLFNFLAGAQPYEASWESIRKRPVTEWCTDAKFGIFIHRGDYSVPAWVPANADIRV